MSKEIVFPNGFDSWQETHFEVVNAISLQYERDKDGLSRASQVNEQEGTGGLYELAKELAFKFEKMHEGKEWGIDDDAQYFEEIEGFLNYELNK